MLYIELKRKIAKEIRNNVYPQGTKLPSERALCMIYQVSKSTIRETLRALQNEGLVRSVNGVGTFVTKQVVHANLNVLTTTKSLISNAGLEEDYVACNIYSQTEDIPTDWQDKLGEDSSYLLIERTRASEGVNLVYTINVFQGSGYQECFSEGLSGSVLEFLKEKKGIRVAYAVSEICIPDGACTFDRVATDVIAGPILLLKQMHYDEQDQPIFYSLDYMNNDQIKFFMRRNR